MNPDDARRSAVIKQANWSFTCWQGAKMLLPASLHIFYWTNAYNWTSVGSGDAEFQKPLDVTCEKKERERERCTMYHMRGTMYLQCTMYNVRCTMYDVLSVCKYGRCGWMDGRTDRWTNVCAMVCDMWYVCMLCYVVSCHVMSCRVMSCHLMSCCALCVRNIRM